MNSFFIVTAVLEKVKRRAIGCGAASTVASQKVRQLQYVGGNTATGSLMNNQIFERMRTRHMGD